LLTPIVLQDRMFDVNGQLLLPNVGINLEHPFWIPEFVGNTIVVNGKAWPFHNVEPKRYRFLFLNGSNARAYELYLTNKATSVKGPAMYVIGTDQGYLDTPAKIDPNAPTNNKLIIMPGERYEVIIDFGGLPFGTKLLLANTARTPYPAGAPPQGSTVGRIMEFRVGNCPSNLCGGVDPSYNPAATPTPLPIRTGGDAIVRLAGSTVHKVRRLTLNEVIAAGGPVEILVNNTPYVGVTYDGVTPQTRTDFTPITTRWNTTHYSELPNEGETELWEIVNLTADAHPIHPHLVGFQLLNRQAFDVKGYNVVYDGAFPGLAYMPGYGPPGDYNCDGPPPGPGLVDPATCTLGGNPDATPFLVGAARPPLPSEAGWKDTVIAYPGQVTRFLVRFAPADTALGATGSYAFNPNGGHGFVWHCHIIDHEDNEMMRPFSVTSSGAARTFCQTDNRGRCPRGCIACY
jgi:FtsP/CotA-like multicopper oxidase with cupredoxin domain